jgi:acetoin utilization deacetylase AcuC-like enzyme
LENYQKARVNGTDQPVYLSFGILGSHHAERDWKIHKSWCVFNDDTLMARVLKVLGKVMILDIDVHQGNGTLSCMDKDGSMLLLDIHDPNIFPVRGEENPETDYYKYDNYLNGKDTKTILKRIENEIEEFGPNAIILNLGFDAYEHDPWGLVGVDKEYYKSVGKIMSDCAKKGICVVVKSGGGYDPSLQPELHKEFMSGF